MKTLHLTTRQVRRLLASLEHEPLLGVEGWHQSGERYRVRVGPNGCPTAEKLLRREVKTQCSG